MLGIDMVFTALTIYYSGDSGLAYYSYWGVYIPFIYFILDVVSQFQQTNEILLNLTVIMF